MFLLRCFIDGEVHQELTLKPGQEALIGRGSFADIELDQFPGISRKHLRVIHLGDKLSVQKISQTGRLIVDGKDHTIIEATETFNFSIPPYNFEAICQKEEVSQEMSQLKSSAGASQVHNMSQVSAAHEASSFSEVGSVHGVSSVDEVSFINEESRPLSNAGSQFAFSGNLEKTNVRSQALVPVFKLIEDNHIIEEFKLEGQEWFFGRSRDNDVSICHSKASRNHFKVFKVDSHFFIEDLKSSNGTFLNGHKLPSETSIELNSGDIISIHDYRLLFEIKDKNLEKQIYNLPQILEPSQIKPSDIQSTDESLAPMGVQKVRTPLLSKIKKMDQRIALMSFIIVILSVFLIDMFFPHLFRNQTDSSHRMIAQKRMIEEEKFIENAKIAALQYIDQANWSHCLSEVQRIQDIRPDDPDAQEINIKCQTALERLERQNQLEAQERKREILLEEVRLNIDECAYLVNQGTLILRECLQPSIEVFPDNEEIVNLLDLAEVVDRKMEEDKLNQEKYVKNLIAGRKILKKADNYKKHKLWDDAIEWYNKYLSGRYPDPKREQRKYAQREIESIQSSLRTGLKQSLEEAQLHFNQGHYKKAVLAARKGLRIDDFHENLLQIERLSMIELRIEVRSLYQDSILMEGLGKIHTAISKWKQIVEIDVPGEDYYQRAERKLEDYETET